MNAKITCLFAALLSAPMIASAQAQDAINGQVSNGLANVVDGFITLSGTFESVSGIDAFSDGRFLSLETVSRPDQAEFTLRTPFPNGMIQRDLPQQVRIHGSETERRITLQGVTRTAIAYSASPETAAGGDLAVSIGLGTCTVTLDAVEPANSICIGTGVDGSLGLGPLQPIEEADQDTDVQGSVTAASFQLVDGQVVLTGDFRGLSGLNAISPAGHLSLQSIEIGDGQLYPLTTPFNNGFTLINNPHEMVIGVLGAEKRINLIGDQHSTAVLYDGTAAEAANDLTIQIGIDKCAVPLEINNPIDFVCLPPQPEPPFTATAQMALGLVDGVVTITGEVKGLRSIFTESPGGHLSLLPSADSGQPGTLPFIERGSATTNRPDAVNLWTMTRPQDTPLLSGITATSIGYSQDRSVADDDLRVMIELGTCLFEIPWGAEIDVSCTEGIPQGGFEVEPQEPVLRRQYDVQRDQIRLLGDFEDISSLTITTLSGNLTADSELPSLLTENFQIAADSSQEISFTALTDGFDFDGTLPTGIRIRELNLSDELIVTVGFANGSSAVLPLAATLIPEPTTAMLTGLGCLSLLIYRPRHRRR